jgi:hypothetical protein
MTPKMPRGAIPAARSELAASEPYRPGADSKIFVPSGAFPTPNYELADAPPYRAAGPTRESFIAWPTGVDFWGGEKPSNSIWAEEAFAKACAEPKVFIPSNVVLSTARLCGSSNFSAFVQTHGFQMNGKAYLDGPFNSVDWTKAAALNNAIANFACVKIGVASANFGAGGQGRVTPGTSGWAIHGLPTAQPGVHCASLFGYGPLPIIVHSFEQHGVNVSLPPGMPAELCYAMFTQGSVGIVDRQSLMNITSEAWVRIPTTIVKSLGE